MRSVQLSSCMRSAAKSYKSHCVIHSIQGNSEAALPKAWSRDLICIDNVRIAVVQRDWLPTSQPRCTTARLAASHHTICRLECYGLYLA